MTLNPDQFYGTKDIEKMFPGGALTAPSPWPRASRRKRQDSYDKDIVTDRLVKAVGGDDDLEDVDPRTLHATQSTITRGGVAYYLNNDQFERTGRTFADPGDVGNRHPFVYDRDDDQRMLLAGHHRAAAALLKGENLRARRVEGPWGKSRRQES